MGYMALGGDSPDKLVFAAVLVLGAGAIWFSLDDVILGGLGNLAQVVVPILVIVDLVGRCGC